jgi:hypothetical protein
VRDGRHRKILSGAEYLYGYDDTIKLDKSGMFLVKGQNRVVLNKMPQGVKRIQILGANYEEIRISSSKVFTFRVPGREILLVELDGEEGEPYEFVFNGSTFEERQI